MLKIQEKKIEWLTKPDEEEILVRRCQRSGGALSVLLGVHLAPLSLRKRRFSVQLHPPMPPIASNSHLLLAALLLQRLLHLASGSKRNESLEKQKMLEPWGPLISEGGFLAPPNEQRKPKFLSLLFACNMRGRGGGVKKCRKPTCILNQCPPWVILSWILKYVLTYVAFVSHRRKIEIDLNFPKSK